MRLSAYKKNHDKFWRAFFVVSGTTIGAGMLALPISVAALGLMWGSVSLIVLWLIMYLAAIIALEINHFGGDESSIPKLSKKYLGKNAWIFGSFILVIMLNALLVAYTSGATSTIQSLLESYTHEIHPTSQIMIVFTLCMGVIICINTTILDASNRVFFMLMMAAFTMMILMLIPQTHTTQKILRLQNSNLSPWMIAFPVFFTSFGFHGSIPSLIKICNRNSSVLKKAFFFGTLLPLFTYLTWIICGLSIIHQHQPQVFSALINNKGDLGTYILALSQTLESPWLQSLSWAFTLFAIITSFIGVAIGLFDYYVEILTTTSSRYSRLIAGFATIGIPFFITIIAEQSFVNILGFAGIFLSILAIILPTIIWLKLFKKNQFKTSLSRLVVTMLFLAGIFVIMCEWYNILF